MARNVAVGWAEVRQMVAETVVELSTRPVRRTERRYRWNGGLYLIRDRFTVAGQFGGCEYAVRNPNGSKRWVRCAEGVDFADIQPYRMRRLDG